MTAAVAATVALVGCARSEPLASAPPITAAATSTSTAAATVAVEAASTTTTTLPVPRYTFPFVGRAVSYGDDHHDYPAIDVFGCGAVVVSPTNGTVVEVRDFDAWDPSTNMPSTRGGMYATVLGVDGVRYYFAHLDGVAVRVGQTVEPGDPLGPMGRTGNARNSACHTHVGFSWPCPGTEWMVRRGMVWPMVFLDAWREGVSLSPVEAVDLVHAAEPGACASAMAQPDAIWS